MRLFLSPNLALKSSWKGPISSKGPSIDTVSRLPPRNFPDPLALYIFIRVGFIPLGPLDSVREHMVTCPGSTGIKCLCGGNIAVETVFINLLHIWGHMGLA